ncbi:MAG: ABC transporter ATP-binding protein [Actinobacteria bacterium]|nr:ABC transporter ATP-binding protein [Actinomycetota bacterium]
MLENNNETIFEVKSIKKRFGGNIVLDGINMSVNRGEIRSIIGPNGAGKTTLFNLISGIYRIDAGQIFFEGKRIDRLTQYQICRLGVARTFQNAKPFISMTVLENVLSGLIFNSNYKANISVLEKEALEILDFVGLKNKSYINAESLIIGDIRRLEIARAIACKPKLIMFDEVLAGLTAQEIESALIFIKKLRDERGITILIVEHNLRIIMKVSDFVSVIHLGKIICSGTPTEVANNQCVIESYMGVKEAQQCLN